MARRLERKQSVIGIIPERLPAISPSSRPGSVRETRAVTSSHESLIIHYDVTEQQGWLEQNSRPQDHVVDRSGLQSAPENTPVPSQGSTRSSSPPLLSAAIQQKDITIVHAQIEDMNDFGKVVA